MVTKTSSKTSPPQPKFKEEAFKLERTLAEITETDIAVSSGEGLQTIWRYTVPTGINLIFSHADVLSAYLENSGAAEVAAGSLIDVIIEDADRQAHRTIFNESRYTKVKEFQDEDLKAHLDVEPGQVVVAREGEHVTIRGNVNTTLDASDSYFNLTCKRVRRSLFTV